VVGHHNLFMLAPNHSIPVTLWFTGHFLLDSAPEKRVDFRARPLHFNTLELLDSQGEPLDFRADTSM
ncbi:unnamed protein product, partial [Symbiodinium necroappetens]